MNDLYERARAQLMAGRWDPTLAPAGAAALLFHVANMACEAGAYSAAGRFGDALQLATAAEKMLDTMIPDIAGAAMIEKNDGNSLKTRKSPAHPVHASPDVMDADLAAQLSTAAALTELAARALDAADYAGALTYVARLNELLPQYEQSIRAKARR